MNSKLFSWSLVHWQESFVHCYLSFLPGQICKLLPQRSPGQIDRQSRQGYSYVNNFHTLKEKSKAVKNGVRCMAARGILQCASELLLWRGVWSIQYYYGALQALQRKKGSILGVKTYPPSIHSSRKRRGGGGGGETTVGIYHFISRLFRNNRSSANSFKWYSKTTFKSFLVKTIPSR